MFNVCAGRAGAAYTNGKLLLLVVNISSWAVLVEMKTFKINFYLLENGIVQKLIFVS